MNLTVTTLLLDTRANQRVHDGRVVRQTVDVALRRGGEKYPRVWRGLRLRLFSRWCLEVSTITREPLVVRLCAPRSQAVHTEDRTSIDS